MGYHHHDPLAFEVWKLGRVRLRPRGGRALRGGIAAWAAGLPRAPTGQGDAQQHRHQPRAHHRHLTSGESGALSWPRPTRGYRPPVHPTMKWARQDSNLRPSGYEPPALPLSYGPDSCVIIPSPRTVARLQVSQPRIACRFRSHRGSRAVAGIHDQLGIER